MNNIPIASKKIFAFFCISLYFDHLTFLSAEYRERWRLLIDRFWARRPGSSLYGGIFWSIFLFSKFCLKKLLLLRASLMVKSGSGVIFFDQFFLCYEFCLKKILQVPGQPRVCHSALYWFVLAFSFTALYKQCFCL